MMTALKNSLGLFLAITLILTCGCGVKKNDMSVDIVPKVQNESLEKISVVEEISDSLDSPVVENTAEGSNLDAQVHIILDSIDSWRMFNDKEDDHFADVCGYAITDLDHNDRVELLVVGNQTYGNFSENHIYEITNDYSSLRELEWKRIGGNAPEPDLLDLDDITVYLDVPAGEYHYMCYDDTIHNAHAGMTDKCDLMIKDGIVNIHNFAGMTYDNTEGNDIEKYFTDKNKSATKNDYDLAEKNTMRDILRLFAG